MIKVALMDRLAGLAPDEAGEALRRVPAFYNFILPAAAAGECDLIDLVCFADPRVPFPWSLNQATRATMIIIGDDPGLALGRGGPDAWRCVERLRRWCRAVIVHAAGGEAAHYAAGVEGALITGRLALIETTTHHAQAWAERLRCSRTLMIRAKSGAHPVPGCEVVH